jgi:hypothetical protein
LKGFFISLPGLLSAGIMPGLKALLAAGDHKDPAFAGSTKSAGMLGRASALTSVFYRQLPPGNKGRKVFQALTGKIKLLLEKGWTEYGNKSLFYIIFI